MNRNGKRWKKRVNKREGARKRQKEKKLRTVGPRNMIKRGKATIIGCHFKYIFFPYILYEIEHSMPHRKMKRAFVRG